MPFLFPARVLLAALLAAAPSTSERPPAAAPPCPAIDAPAPAAFRVRAFVDPATGRLREPTADELRQLAEERLATRAAAPPRVFVIVEHPDGMKSVDLGDAFLFDVKVETGEDGACRIVCVPPSGPAANPPQ
jgi:hypothetical protein